MPADEHVPSAAKLFSDGVATGRLWAINEMSDAIIRETAPCNDTFQPEIRRFADATLKQLDQMQTPPLDIKGQPAGFALSIARILFSSQEWIDAMQQVASGIQAGVPDELIRKVVEHLEKTAVAEKRS